MVRSNVHFRWDSVAKLAWLRRLISYLACRARLDHVALRAGRADVAPAGACERSIPGPVLVASQTPVRAGRRIQHSFRNSSETPSLLWLGGEGCNLTATQPAPPDRRFAALRD